MYDFKYNHPSVAYNAIKTISTFSSSKISDMDAAFWDEISKRVYLFLGNMVSKYCVWKVIVLGEKTFVHYFFKLSTFSQ